MTCVIIDVRRIWFARARGTNLVSRAFARTPPMPDRITIIHDDITRVAVDSIVNAANDFAEYRRALAVGAPSERRLAGE